ncbi:MAG: hypothetical protein QM770_04690 [Tepidisphaeraceae bacterium]
MRHNPTVRFLLVGTLFIATGATAMPTVPAPTYRAEKQSNDAKKASEVRQTLVSALNDAITAGDLDRFLDSLSKSARDQVKDNLKKEDRDRFKNAAEKLRTKWRDQYGKDFNLADSTDAFQNFDVDIQTRDDRELAIVLVTNPDDQTKYNMHLVRQEGGWRLLLPSRESGRYFFSNLAAAVSQTADGNLPRNAENGASQILTRFYKPLAYGDESTADSKDR